MINTHTHNPHGKTSGAKSTSNKILIISTRSQSYIINNHIRTKTTKGNATSSTKKCFTIQTKKLYMH